MLIEGGGRVLLMLLFTGLVGCPISIIVVALFAGADARLFAAAAGKKPFLRSADVRLLSIVNARGGH